jgi:hypothetical protein
MAAIDYFGIAEEMAEIIHANKPDIMVVVEEELIIGPDNHPIIAVYVDSREVPANQPIASGRKMRIIVHFAVWVWSYGLNVKEAIRERDDLIGDVELILMQNRTINDLVDMLWIDGGKLPTAMLPDSSGFTSGGEIIVRAEVMAET